MCTALKLCRASVPFENGDGDRLALLGFEALPVSNWESACLVRVHVSVIVNKQVRMLDCKLLRREGRRHRSGPSPALVSAGSGEPSTEDGACFGIGGIGFAYVRCAFFCGRQNILILLVLGALRPIYLLILFSAGDRHLRTMEVRGKVLLSFPINVTKYN